MEGTKVVFKFTVTAENGTATKDYTVNVTKAAVQEDVTTAAFSVVAYDNTITLTATEGTFDETEGIKKENYTVAPGSSDIAVAPTSVEVSGNKAILTFETAVKTPGSDVTVTVKAGAFAEGTVVTEVTGAASTVE